MLCRDFLYAEVKRVVLPRTHETLKNSQITTDANVDFDIITQNWYITYTFRPIHFLYHYRLKFTHKNMRTDEDKNIKISLAEDIVIFHKKKCQTVKDNNINK